ncbi:MAG: helix-turn-helix transcriptional regulator, partial [Vallitaleaceae bacterium]|nr:helix-turn-helix transcriptional regulator [Vallitaleaceae bacterium]
HEKRIAKAVVMMEESSYSLEAIAEKCGYCNLLTFRRNFKSVMGVNPGDYKQRS